MHSPPFLILGLPRSATAWLSTFLTCGPVFCHHELSGKVQTWDEFVAMMGAPRFTVIGNSDSGALLIWRDLVQRLPNLRIVCIRRDPGECSKSWARVLGFQSTEPFIRPFVVQLEECINEQSPLVVEYRDLESDDVCRKIWDYVANGSPLPPQHLAKMRTLRVVQDENLIRRALGGSRRTFLTEHGRRQYSGGNPSQSRLPLNTFD